MLVNGTGLGQPVRHYQKDHLKMIRSHFHYFVKFHGENSELNWKIRGVFRLPSIPKILTRSLSNYFIMGVSKTQHDILLMKKKKKLENIQI